MIIVCVAAGALLYNKFSSSDSTPIAPVNNPFVKPMCYKYVTATGITGDSSFFFDCNMNPTGFGSAMAQANPIYGSSGSIEASTGPGQNADLYCIKSVDSEGRMLLYPASLSGGTCATGGSGTLSQAYLPNSNFNNHMSKMCYKYLGPSSLRTVIYPASNDNCDSVNSNVVTFNPTNFAGLSGGTGTTGGTFWK